MDAHSEKQLWGVDGLVVVVVVGWEGHIMLLNLFVTYSLRLLIISLC